MNDELKPIKRSDQLAPFSREHHDGLVFASRIRQGLKKNAPLQSIADYVNWFWENHLLQHFRKEEELLMPKMPRYDELMKRMTEEHEEIEARIHINKNIADETNLGEIADRINEHIRFEERSLFPHIEKHLLKSDLDAIFDELEEAAPACGQWQNEFWK